MSPDGGWKILNWIMCGFPTGGKPEFLHRGEFILLSQVSSKEGRIIQGFKVDIFL